MKTGCLLIHGWAGAPFEMEPLVAPLESMGCVVRNCTLPGHGATFEEFCTTWFEDWAGGAESAYQQLAGEVDRVVVMGLSMGGALALHLASRYPVAGVVTMASPVYVYRLFPPQMKDWRLPLVRFLRHVRPIWPGEPRRAEANAIAPWQGYDGATSLPQLWSLIEGVRGVGKNLHKVTAPLLAMHCPTDKTAPSGNVWEIVRGVSSQYRRMELIPIEEKVTAHHMLTTHRETRDRVCGLIQDFLTRNVCL
ncbi:alpha/beta fold hydrolase [Desulfovibrio mangrovi]|uniref:alpha/beta hydrolase n=1 Tax=Desulfovibrio mangrovi TaxID=2976983 RepID=UPI00224772E0|nr:alpha/beta fold hydrolase [Desulfovibrio mangrovi]UZP68211.1 alpha/beta fold hydrolase [Desulfovibrio mangrovi]